MNKPFQKEYTSVKRRRQIQLIECISRVVDLYTEEYQIILPIEFQQFFSTILDKGIQCLLLYGIYLSEQRDEELIETQFQEKYIQEEQLIKFIKDNLVFKKDIIYNKLKSKFSSYPESQAQHFFEKLTIATVNNAFDVKFFEPQMKEIFEDMQKIIFFLLNQKGPYIFQQDRPFLEFSALISIICINKFQFDRDIQYTIIKMIHLDHLQDIIKNPLEFLNSPSLQQ
ncbi:hypothetical protein ABPG72_002421 [Tetrahymena utriculariae]